MHAYRFQPTLKIALLLSLLSGLFTGMVAHSSTLTFRPLNGTADGTVVDGFSGRDGVPDLLQLGPLQFFAGLQDAPHTPEDARAVVEFDTPGLLHQNIGSAILSLTEYGTQPDSFVLYGYEGNGTVDLTDFSQTAFLITAGSTQRALAIGRTLFFDATDFVRAHPTPHIAFMLRDTSLNSPTDNGECCGFARFVSFDDLGAPFPMAALLTEAQLPTLTIQVVPEPSTWLLLGSGLAAMILWRKRTAQETS